MALEVLAKLPTNAAIQASLLSKNLKNSDSLPEMRALLKEYSSTRGNLDFLKAVHVAGSKGKGSVCAFVESLLRSSCGGLKTGMFTSPHLVHPRERIRIDGRPVAEEVFAKHVLALNDRLQAGQQVVSFFRFLWMVALEVFLEAGIDVGVIEVGMGGRFDATNVIDRPVVCGITSLAMEHVALLGPTIREIAWNKAGIMKSSCRVFTVPQTDPEAMEVLQREASVVGTKLQVVQPIDFNLQKVKLGIEGEHQRLNAGLACALAQEWLLKERGLTSPLSISALQSVHWPGRHQRHCLSADTELFLDGSHTVESVSYSAEWFTNSTSNQSQQHLVFHCSADRDYRALLTPLLGIEFVSVTFAIPKGALALGKDFAGLIAHHEAMAEFWKQSGGKGEVRVATQIDESLFQSLSGNVLICGSLYLVGAVMELYKIET